ncbi:hypothetical protein VUR80DRAFT_1485 [Thermomyces stellatus]
MWWMIGDIPLACCWAPETALSCHATKTAWVAVSSCSVVVQPQDCLTSRSSSLHRRCRWRPGELSTCVFSQQRPVQSNVIGQSVYSQRHCNIRCLAYNAGREKSSAPTESNQLVMDPDHLQPKPPSPRPRHNTFISQNQDPDPAQLHNGKRKGSALPHLAGKTGSGRSTTTLSPLSNSRMPRTDTQAILARAEPFHKAGNESEV